MKSKEKCTEKLIEYVERMEDQRGHSDRDMESEAGINHGVISKMRKGDCMVNNVSAETCWRICRYAGITLDAIFEDDSNFDDRNMTIYKIGQISKDDMVFLDKMVELLYRSNFDKQ